MNPTNRKGEAMPEAKRKGGGRQGSYWTNEKDERLVARAAKKASKRASAQTDASVTITPSKWKHDAIMAAARAELARK